MRKGSFLEGGLRKKSATSSVGGEPQLVVLGSCCEATDTPLSHHFTFMKQPQENSFFQTICFDEHL